MKPEYIHARLMVVKYELNLYAVSLSSLNLFSTVFYPANSKETPRHSYPHSARILVCAQNTF